MLRIVYKNKNGEEDFLDYNLKDKIPVTFIYESEREGIIRIEISGKVLNYILSVFRNIPYFSTGFVESNKMIYNQPFADFILMNLAGKTLY